MGDAIPPEILEMVRQIVEENEAGLKAQITRRDEQIEELQNRLRLYQGSKAISVSDYQRLEQELRNEREENSNLQRNLSEYETRCQQMKMQMDALERQVQRANSDMAGGVQGLRQKDDQIDHLRSEIKRLEENTEKQRAEILSGFSERKMLNEKVRVFTEQNNEMSNAIEDLLNREQQLMEVLNERNNLVSELEGMLNESKQKRPKRERRDDTKPAAEQTPSDGGGKYQELYRIERKKVSDLKERIFKLEDMKQRSIRLQSALEAKTTQVEQLQKELDDRELQLVMMQQSAQAFSNQADTYRERQEFTSRQKDEQIKELEERLDQLIAKSQDSVTKAAQYEQSHEEQEEELKNLRVLLKKYEDSHFGLSDAIREAKELRAMVDLRDRHIAELVQQTNMMDKVICGLALELGGDFDSEKFLSEYQSSIERTERKRIEVAERELKSKIESMKSLIPPPSLHIEVADQRFEPEAKKPTLSRFGVSLVSIEPTDDGLSVKEEEEEKERVKDREITPHAVVMEEPKTDEWLIENVQRFKNQIRALKKERNSLREQLETERNRQKVSEGKSIPTTARMYVEKQDEASQAFIPGESIKPRLAISKGVSQQIKDGSNRRNLAESRLVHLPTAEMERVIGAREAAQEKQRNTFLQQIAELKVQNESLKDEIEVLQTENKGQKAQIETLRKQISEQMKSHQEQLETIKIEADNYVTARLNESQMANLVGMRAQQDDVIMKRLEQYSKQIEESNRRNLMLEMELNEARDRLARIQEENLVITEDARRRAESQRDQAQLNRTTKIMEKNRSLAKELETLRAKYKASIEKIREMKSELESRVRPEELESSASQNEDEAARLTVKLRKVRAQLTDLKSRSAETDAIINRQKSTIERLTQLLQTKETQIVRMNQQNAMIKQQNTALKQRIHAHGNPQK